MLKIELKRDLEKLLKDLGEVKSKQLPYAISKTVNEIAIKAKPIIQQNFNESLNIKNKSLIKKAIQINFSNKNQFPYIEAEIGVAEGFEFLSEHATGATRNSKSSHGKAIPQEIQRSSSGKIPASKKPGVLLGKKKVFVMKTRRGEVIAQRVSNDKYPVKILYGFKKSVNIFKRLDPFAGVVELATKNFDKMLGKNLETAIASAKK